MRNRIIAVAAMLTLGLTQVPQLGHSADWPDLWWLQKTSRALRGGDGLKTTENPDVLLSQGREHVVDQFLADPRFADTVLDFNLMVLGFRRDRIRKESGNYEDIIYELPHAVSSAKSILNGGDYFSLFDLEHPIYLGPLLRPAPLDPADSALDPATLRKKVYATVQADLDRILAMAQATPAATPLQLCTDFNTHMEKYVFDNAFNLPPTIPRTVMLDLAWYGNMNNICNTDPIPAFDFVAGLSAIKAQNDKLFTKLAAFEPVGYATTTLNELRVLDLSDQGLAYHHTPFTRTIQLTLPNSSTNYDRKRAAYTLQRFFCDDLTPVNVEAPATHAGSAHASNPSCFACHYKLDPMAGFFRDFGRNFKDYGQRKYITFDDGAYVPLAQYIKGWQPGPDAAHLFNVGYVRSTTDLSANTYGNDVKDLYGILKTAPEVKRCLMRRMTEYFTSDDQSVDGDYIDWLTEQFNADLALGQGTTLAVKNAASRIVLSNAFSTPNADSATCYDTRPGQVPGSGAPCQIASVLTKSCVHCHSSSAQSPGLNLTAWQTFSDGSQGFVHLDASGKQVPTVTTFQEMLDRISTTDPDQRMPYLGDMPSTDRQQLYLWLNEELTQGILR